VDTKKGRQMRRGRGERKKVFISFSTLNELQHV
jgi:hypothetical protein